MADTECEGDHCAANCDLEKFLTLQNHIDALAERVDISIGGRS